MFARRQRFNFFEIGQAIFVLSPDRLVFLAPRGRQIAAGEPLNAVLIARKPMVSTDIGQFATSTALRASAEAVDYHWHKSNYVAHARTADPNHSACNDADGRLL
jgi:hypothetical protein